MAIKVGPGDSIKIIANLLGPQDLMYTGSGYKCRWCGREYSTEEGKDTLMCRSEDCPGYLARRHQKVLQEVDELRTHNTDIRQILYDNIIKDMRAAEGAPAASEGPDRTQQHAIKKLLRAVKSKKICDQDIEEAIMTLRRLQVTRIEGDD